MYIVKIHPFILSLYLSPEVREARRPLSSLTINSFPFFFKATKRKEVFFAAWLPVVPQYLFQITWSRFNLGPPLVNCNHQHHCRKRVLLTE